MPSDAQPVSAGFRCPICLRFTPLSEEAFLECYHRYCFEVLFMPGLVSCSVGKLLHVVLDHLLHAVYRQLDQPAACAPHRRPRAAVPKLQSALHLCAAGLRTSDLQACQPVH